MRKCIVATTNKRGGKHEIHLHSFRNIGPPSRLHNRQRCVTLPFGIVHQKITGCTNAIACTLDDSFHKCACTRTQCCFTCGSPPKAANLCTVSLCPQYEANHMGVAPELVIAFMSAPWSTRASTTAVRPQRAAACRSVKLS